MPMTPDEVVKEMQKRLSEAEKQRAEYGYPNKEVNKFIEIQKQAISLLQDYQKLRERIHQGKFAQILHQVFTEKVYNEKLFEAQGKAIVTYLQQPTEH